MLRENMRLIAECSQQLVRLGENLWGKEQELDKEMQEHQKLCDEIMAIQGIEPIEAEMEQIIHCPDDYIFKDENGNVINTTKIVLEKKKKEYPKTYKECLKILNTDDDTYSYISYPLSAITQLLICRDAYYKIAGEEMGLGKPWEPDWKNSEEKRYCIVNIEGDINLPEKILTKWILKVTNKILVFPTEEMRDAFYENFKELIESVKELL